MAAIVFGATPAMLPFLPAILPLLALGIATGAP